MSSAARALVYKFAPPRLRFAFDRDYLERLARGDAEVEGHFVAYFGELLLIKLRSRLHYAPAVAFDLRQETFVRFFHALRVKNAIRQPERIAAYIVTVCENVLLEYFRSGKRPVVPLGPNDSEVPDRARSAESELITEERTAMVKQILAELPERDRKVLRAVYLEERDKDEVCAEMGINRDYLRLLIHRALAKFRSRYKGCAA